MLVTLLDVCREVLLESRRIFGQKSDCEFP